MEPHHAGSVDAQTPAEGMVVQNHYAGAFVMLLRGAMEASAVPNHIFEEELAERAKLIETGSGTLYHA